MNVLDPKLNFAVCTASAGYAAGDTILNLTSGHGARLPDPGTDGAFNLVWWNSTDYATPSEDPFVEIIRVTARTSDQITVTRAQESTSATDKNLSGKTYSLVLGLTAKDWTDVDDELGRLDEVQSELLTAGGTANALTATPTTAWTAYANGLRIRLAPASDNATGGTTLNVSGLGAVAVKDSAGNDLEAGALRAGIPADFVHNGTNFRLIGSGLPPRAGAKAWVFFDASSGTPTVGDSHNVASITDHGVGDFTINFTKPFSSTNYVPVVGGYQKAGVYTANIYESNNAARTTLAVRFISYDRALGTNYDIDRATLAFFGSL